MQSHLADGGWALQGLISQHLRVALQGCTHRLCWERRPCRAWWLPSPTASLAWCPFPTATRPWKRCTPTASCRIQVRHAGGNHLWARRAALSSLFLDPCSKGFSCPPCRLGAVSVCAVPFAVLLMLFFFAAQSPSVAETLHPAFSGVQQYAGTALPSLPPSSLRPTAPGKRFVLSPRITAVYPTTSITPITQSIPQPPPVLQQQQREGEDGRLWGSRGERLSPWGGMWGSPRGFQLCGS